MNCIKINLEKMAKVFVKSVCNEIESLDFIQESLNAMCAIKYLNGYKVDLIFSGIYFPNFSGADFIKTPKNLARRIFWTSSFQLETKAFKYDYSIYYILKPIHLKLFVKALKKFKTPFFHINQLGKGKDVLLLNDFYVNAYRRFIKISAPNFLGIKNKELNNCNHMLSHHLKSLLQNIYILTKCMKQYYIEALEECRNQTKDLIKENLEKKDKVILEVLKHYTICRLEKERYKGGLNLLVDNLISYLKNRKMLKFKF